MTAFSDYTDHDAVGLAGLIASGDVSAEEVLDAAVARLAEVQPALNPVVHDMEAEARRVVAAGLPGAADDGPLRGVPIVLKDLNMFYAGQPTTNGCRYYAGFVPDHDTEYLARLRRAGVVVTAKANTPEFGLCPSTEPVMHGPTRNPWDPTRSSGGSSGGSAVAVATGVVPAGQSGDGGGSIRIPASACGLVGLKTTRQRTPTGPDLMDSLHAVTHVVCRTVRDSAAFLDAVHGQEAGTPHPMPARARPFLEEVGTDPGRLRVAMSTKVPAGAPLDRACVEAVERTAAVLEGMGHVVEPVDPPVDHEWIYRSWRINAGVYARVAIDRRTAAIGRAPGPDELEAVTRLSIEEAGRMSAPDYLRLIQDLHQFGRRMEVFHQTHDVLLTPTLATVPPPLGHLAMTNEDLDEYYKRFFEFCAFTPQQNFSGQPAITLPLHWSEEGLPVGVQLATRLGEDALLLRLAARLEEAMPWRDRRPEAF